MSLTRLFAAVLVSLVLAAPAAQAAVDFTGIDGTYVGNYALNLGGTLVTSRTTTTITVPKNGRKATMEILGVGDITSTPGAQIALWGTHTFRSNRRVSSDNVLLAMYALIPAAPTKFSGNVKRFSFTLANAGSSVGATAMSYTVSAGGKRLAITGTGNLGSQTITLSLTAKKVGRNK